MKKILVVLLLILSGAFVPLYSQIKISDSGSTSPDANSILELESTTRGFLGPRVTLTDLNAVTPLTGTVPEGMLIYNDGGTITNGYYVWTGSKWVLINTGFGNVNVVTHNSNSTLTKLETFVAASGDITLTLPVVTAEDNGLAIVVKNTGTHTDLITVVGNGGATIDGNVSSRLTRWKTRTYIAYNGNWYIRERDIETTNIYEVGSSESWTTITEILEFLDTHMTAPSKVRLDGGTYDITTTQTVDLPYALTIEGPSYGQSTIAAANGITNGTPLFILTSEVSFKMIAFDATGLAGYGADAGENALNLVTSEQYHEIKDCTFDGFYNAIYITENVDIWLFESDISNSTNAGVEIDAGTSVYVSFYTSESDFSNCDKAINLASGDSAYISIQNCTFTCDALQTGLDYDPTNFTNTVSLFFTNNTWNNEGTFINTTTGFDFSLSRDANAEIINNAGIGDKKPQCKINVVNNVSTTTITTAGTYYKANWTNTSAYTVKWNINNNRFTYLPTNSKDVVVYISGNVSVNQSNRTVTIGILKNGTGSISGEISLRGTLLSAGAIVPFSTVVYLQDVEKDDYFEVFATSSSNGDVLTFSDVNIYATSE